ncbi:DeoR/GlpR family DNA-binding transcription regulator [Vallicoccus soli]|uniref:Lactose phosphotransferase system repressor n=1 Tax=Vallicoccus soli TaxID=2339232 RepID=A0A3A3Z196_9ACTN|nr:DeoR/GlpR family DNA-binding transcription regulator [Vallicoccus soli]RJK96277.1 DeoR/GlpR transcriptional regulator [Vallicoccus soli]
MYATERQQAILARAREHGRAEVAQLAADLAVTPETIRRDLTALERQGLLRRVHGGAIPVERLGAEAALATREARLVTEKERIAKRALEEVPEEGSVVLDAGSTTVRLAEALPAERRLTVVTNSLPIAALLAARPGIALHVVGGQARSQTQALVGDWAASALADVCVDVAFMGTNGMSPQRGLTTADRQEAGTKRAMMAAARRCVVLADHTKAGTDHFASFARLDQVDLVVSDTGLDPDLADELAAAGPEVVLA